MYWLKLRIGLQLAVRAAVGAAVSLAIARWLKLDTPVLALIAAVIVTDRDPAETRKLAVRRIVSTGIGAACGAALAQFLGQNSWEAGIAIFISVILSVAFTQLGDPRIAAYICALIVVDFGDDPLQYGFYRFIETVLGIGVAWAISQIPKLIEIKGPAEDRKA